MTPRRILLAGWLLFMLYAYPGYLMRDGADQLVDSRYGVFTDWHSPMMTQVWRIVGIVVSGPAGMLILQSLLLLIGSYQLLRRVMSDRGAAIAASCVLVFPPIMASTAVISPEAQLASWLVAGSAALLSEQLKTRLVGIGMMVIACGLRDGAALAALPLIAALFYVRADQARWQRVALALATWAVVAGTATGLDRLFVDAKFERDEVELAMIDIVGTLHYASTIDDAEVRPLLEGVTLASSTDIQKRAHKVYGKQLFYAVTEERVFESPETEAQRDALFAARRAVMRAYPRDYLEHRWHQFYRVLGLSRVRPSPVYTEFVALPIDAEALQHLARHSVVQSMLIAPVGWLSDTLWFRPYLYFVLAILLLAVAAVRKQREAGVLLASAVLYELALMFLTSRVEFRDSLWMIVATVLAIILLVARGATRSSRP